MFFKFEIILNDLVRSFRIICIPMLWVYDRYKYIYSFSAGLDLNLEVRIWRLQTSDSDV